MNSLATDNTHDMNTYNDNLPHIVMSLVTAIGHHKYLAICLLAFT